MKKLRKIFVAIAVLALLISSVTVLVVTADDDAVSYTGELSKAQELLADVPAMDRTDSTTDLRKEAIKKVYNYLRAYPIDPETEGYAEFYAEFYNMSLMILNKYYDKFVEDPKEATLEVVLSYVNAFPIPSGTPDPDGDGVIERKSSSAIIGIIIALLIVGAVGVLIYAMVSKKSTEQHK